MNIAQYVMPPNRAWNRQGPHVSSWWRERLKRIDPRLVLQYMPPADPTDSKNGVNRKFFPQGVWVICRKMPRSGLLHKEWVWGLTGTNQKWKQPGMGTLKLIRRAYNLHKRKKMGELERALDRSAVAIMQATHQKSRERLANQIAFTCRQLNISKASMGVPRVSFAGAHRT